MKQFVFKTFNGYFTGRKIVENIGRYVKYKVGVTNNDIPIYRWNVGMILKSKNAYVDSKR